MSTSHDPQTLAEIFTKNYLFNNHCMGRETGPDDGSKFEAVIDGLSLDVLKALHAIQVRDGIIERNDFEHVVNMSGTILDDALVELTKLGLVEEIEGTWSMTPEFRAYWEKTNKISGGSYSFSCK
ncbi:hypothetical protein KKG41_00750 [Patescibacteria group bacterium]|nr:hypothetical protein [Patescibacteria group bacterium]MBU1891003.1 hypothetical protein [Patescibacteria group bacterium]